MSWLCLPSRVRWPRCWCERQGRRTAAARLHKGVAGSGCGEREQRMREVRPLALPGGRASSTTKRAWQRFIAFPVQLDTEVINSRGQGMHTRQSDWWQAAGGGRRRRQQVPHYAPLKLLPRLAGRLSSSALSYRSTELLLGRLARSPCDVRRPAIAAGPPDRCCTPADRWCGVQGRRQPPPGDRVSCDEQSVAAGDR